MYITRRVVDVRDFGAKLDGVTYDDVALDNAIKSITKGSVYIPSGVMLIPDDATITVPEGINIIGDGWNKTIVRQIDGYPSYRIFNCLGKQKIQGITIDSQIGIMPSGNNLEIIKCKFVNGVQSIQVVETVTNLKVKKCIFEDNPGYGILFNLQPSYNCLIEDCKFINTEGDFIEINSPCERIKIEDCTFEDNFCTQSSAGFGVGVAVKAKQVTINKCSFNNIFGQGVHVEDYAEVTISNCKFKNCGNDAYNGSPRSDISVISEAKVDIYKIIHYEAEEGYSETALFCTGATAKADRSTYYKRSVEGGVSLSKCKFYGSNKKQENDKLQFAVQYPELSTTIVDCEFYDYRIGIVLSGKLYGSYGGKISNCRFENCDFGISQGKTQDTRLYLDGSDEEITKCKFINCGVGINMPNGEVAPRGYYLITNNVFQKCSTPTILADYTPGFEPIVEDNKIINK
jgi:hypothetical protein